MSRRKPRKSSSFQYFLAGGSLLALVGLLADVRTTFEARPVSNVCQEVVQPQSVLSRDELSQVLAVPERDAKTTIQAIVSDPYCRLEPVEIRQGVVAERDVYPLAFDPQTWFVLLYEGEEYAGYSFVFQK
ncbi:MAG: hypothetical protein AAFX78_09895 [Cyanobacteria bacterium J06638_20]